MYAYIEGTLEHIGLDSVVLDNHGIGYEIRVPVMALAQLKLRQTVRLHTYLSIREDAHTLYGFISAADRRMFERLIGVSGIGAKAAISLLGALSAEDLAIALATGDDRMLARAPGIGRKTAQRLVLELREKVDQQELLAAGLTGPAPAARGMVGEAMQALVALGFSGAEAAMAIEQVREQAGSVQELIALALKQSAQG